ncbi:MAG: hypothetical protein M3347_05535, partial [Armatimonadota bacterium]|nr:hypothetical protein [Armatimonadota bacterium]
AYECAPMELPELFRAALERAGKPHLARRPWVHDWEVAVTSQVAMLRAIASEAGQQVLQAARDLRCAQSRPGFYAESDIGLCMALLCEGIAPHNAPFLSCSPLVDQFSLWGGAMHQIHRVSPDYPESTDFITRVAAWLSEPGTLTADA